MSSIDSAHQELQNEYHIMEIWGFSHGRVGKVTDLHFKDADSNPGLNLKLSEHSHWSPVYAI
jgi:hypothetical protein